GPALAQHHVQVARRRFRLTEPVDDAAGRDQLADGGRAHAGRAAMHPDVAVLDVGLPAPVARWAGDIFEALREKQRLLYAGRGPFDVGTGSRILDPRTIRGAQCLVLIDLDTHRRLRKRPR